MTPFLTRVILFSVALLCALPCAAATRYKTLQDAAEKGDVAAARYLLQHGAVVDAPIGKYHLTALAFAAANDAFGVVKLLVAHHANVNARSTGGNTPLMYGAGGGAHATTISFLLQHGADAAAKDAAGVTALHFAALYGGRPEVVALLVRHGAPVNAEDQDGETPLTDAAQKGRDAMVRALISNGASGAYAIVWESYKNQTDAVRTLIDAGVDVDARYPGRFGAYDRSTALIEAARQNNFSMAALLLQHHADVNAMLPDHGNMTTPLMFAAYNCNAEMVRLLATYGARDNVRESEGNAYDLARSGWTDTMQPCSSDVLSALADLQ